MLFDPNAVVTLQPPRRRWGLLAFSWGVFIAAVGAAIFAAGPR